MHYCIWRWLDQYFVLELLSSQTEIKHVKKQGRIQGLVLAHRCYGNVYTNSFIQTMHCDTFKQTWVADPGIHKVFNSTFLSVLLILGVWERADASALKIWLLTLFCLSSPLIWAPSLGAQAGIPASESLW